MKFITFLKKQMALAFGVGVLLSFSSCGSFQYSGIYDDGIYSESVPAQPANETVDNSSNSSEYYKNYFKEKSLQIEDNNTVFTDVDSYGGTYADDSENTNNYAGWGENNSSDIVVNVYDNGPFYGNGWGFNYRNNWGWNLGWNNWGFGFWQPNYYNPWNIPWNIPWNNPWYNPFCYYGSYNNYGYFNNGYNRYRGRSYAYINGGRSRSRYGNSRSLSSRSVLNATTRSRATTTRPNSRSTTRSRSNSITRPTTTRSSNNSTRSNSTYRSTRSTTRSSSPSRSTTRSSSPSRSRRSSGGSSSRRRNN